MYSKLTKILSFLPYSKCFYTRFLFMFLLLLKFPVYNTNVQKKSTYLEKGCGCLPVNAISSTIQRKTGVNRLAYLPLNACKISASEEVERQRKSITRRVNLQLFGHAALWTCDILLYFYCNSSIFNTTDVIKSFPFLIWIFQSWCIYLDFFFSLYIYHNLIMIKPMSDILSKISMSAMSLLSKNPTPHVILILLLIK